jgi:uncharacterized protein with FMN-binding domain
VAAVLLAWGHASAQAQDRSGQEAARVWHRADALRLRQDWPEAADTYETAAGTFANAPRFSRLARAMAEFCRAMPGVKGVRLKDGTYEAAETGYIAAVRVAVTVARGRIASVRIVEHKENRPLKAIADVPARIVREQTPSVDAVSGATITSYAVMNAARKALEQAAPPAAAPAVGNPAPRAGSWPNTVPQAP